MAMPVTILPIRCTMNKTLINIEKHKPLYITIHTYIYIYIYLYTYEHSKNAET